MRLGEHKQEARRGDPKNGIAVHAHETQHEIDWDNARVKSTTPKYCQRRIMVAIRIKTSGGVMNWTAVYATTKYSVEPCTYSTLTLSMN